MNEHNGFTTPDDWICVSCGRPRSAHECLLGFTRLKVPFVGMLRVRNEARWIAEVIQSIRPLCERIYVMDDHSTDDTVKICNDLRYGIKDNAHYEQVKVLASPFDGLNEARDKNWLYDQIIRECEPEWILCIDGDEVLEVDGPERICRWCEPKADTSYRLKIEFLWNDTYHVRRDGVYGDFWRPSLFRPFIPQPGSVDDLKTAQETRWKATPWGRHVEGNAPNLHCSSVPQRFLDARAIPVRLKHYGYMHKVDRIAKLDYYTSIDWKNDAEDWYRHMCQGDNLMFEDLPRIRGMIERGLLTFQEAQTLFQDSAVKLVHAGPLRLEHWNERDPWQMTEWARSL